MPTINQLVRNRRANIAKRNKVPIFHLEAGNRCFDLRVPEEINRKIIDHVSDIHLTYSSIAREYLLSEGLPKNQIIKVGSPMKEVVSYYDSKIKKAKIACNKDTNKTKNKIFSNLIFLKLKSKILKIFKI